MTGTTTTTAEASLPPVPGTALRPTGWVRGAWVVAVRTGQMYRHAPGLLLVTLAAPLGMTLLFGFVFGGALAGGDDPAAYRAYLLPGVFVLVAAMGLVATASSTNDDLRSGLTDRFRSLPVPSGAVPTGLALAETVTGLVALALMAGVGLLVGWRVTTDPAHALLGVLLLVVVRLALSWLGVLLGAAVRDERMLQQVEPLVFAAIMFSNVFTPTGLMPGVVRVEAEWNPVSAFVAALRELFGNTMGVATSSAWPLQHPVVASAIWVVVLLAVAAPAAVRSSSSSR